MVRSRFKLRLLGVAAAASAAIAGSSRAMAVETLWNVPGTDDWHEDANWSGAFGALTPLWEFSEAANVNNGGTAVVSTDRSQLMAGLGNTTQGVAGVRLGMQGVGNLSIVAGGNLTSSTNGEDGIVNVGGFGTGGPGTGTLIMNGTQPSPAVLTASALSVSGNVGSLADLSGYSTLTATNNIPNAVAQGSGNLNFDRNLRITGPNVNVTGTGAVTVGNYTAVVTAATHSTIKSPGVLTINTGGGGTNLNLQFSGYTPVVGNTWNLFDTGSIAASRWDNIAAGGFVPHTLTGGASALPVGAGLRLKTANGGTNGLLLQVVAEANLVLTVNRDSGEMTLRNPLGAAVPQLTGYEVVSARGSLLNSYKGISGAPAGNPGWEKAPTNSANGLAEFKPSGTFNVAAAGTTVALGTGFNKLAFPSTGGLGNLGQTGEDLTFRYTSFDGSVLFGQVEYTGTPFLNNISIVATPSGQAILKNDSTQVLSIDGYIISSSTGALSGAGWTSLTDRTDTRFDGWEETPATTSVLAESNPEQTPALTIAAGESFTLGDIGDFSTVAAQGGLTLSYILTGEANQRAGSVRFAASLGLAGDFNADGRVNGADFLVWQRNHSVGSLADWKANFGATSATVSASAVPEPNAIALSGVALAMGVLARRRRTEA
jgi:hypothetical protein